MMVRRLVLFTLLICCFGVGAQSRWELGSRTLKFNLPALAIGYIPYTSEYKIGAEFATGYWFRRLRNHSYFMPKQSIYIGVSYLGTNLFFQHDNNYDQLGHFIQYSEATTTHGVRITGGLKQFITEQTYPRSFYIGGFVSYAFASSSVKGQEDNLKVHYASLDLALGHQVLIIKCITLDTGLGLGYCFQSYRSVIEPSPSYGVNYNIHKASFTAYIEIGYLL